MTAIPHSFDAPHDDAHAHHHEEVSFLKKYIFSVDHKIIGIQFLFMGLIFLVVGGLLAMLIRWQLAYPSDPNYPVPILGQMLGWPDGIMPHDFYNMVFTMHATIMIFFVIIPLLVGTFGNYLIPLKIGAGDMAFPFLHGLAFWTALPAGAIMVASFMIAGGAAQTGWTVYPPLSAIMTAEIGVTSPGMWMRCFVSMPSCAICSKMKRLEVSFSSPIGPQIEARPPSRTMPIAPLSALPPQISSNAVAFSLEPRPGTPGV
jgi:cytochrome c oxidase subunit I